MSAMEAFERTVATWLDEQAGTTMPGYLDEILEATGGTSQRPAWASLERWLPVQATMTLQPTRRVGWILLTALALLLLVVAIALTVGSRPRLPAPFGPAGNGRLAYASEDGDIYTFEQATGRSTRLIAGTDTDYDPVFSRDGSMLVFSRAASDDLASLVLARADGTVVRALTKPIDIRAVDWSPDSTRLAVIDGSGSTFLIVEADGSAVRPIDITGIVAREVHWLPDGRSLVFGGVPPNGSPTGVFGLYVVAPDGTGLRALGESVDNAGHWQGPAVSPDGTRIAYTQWSGNGHLLVLDLDSGITSAPWFTPPAVSNYFASWSPDGTLLLFHRGQAGASFHLSVAPAAGGTVVDIGPVIPTDEAGAAPAQFSPDGRSIIAHYPDGSTWLLDPAGGAGQRLDLDAEVLASWQRVNP